MNFGLLGADFGSLGLLGGVRGPTAMQLRARALLASISAAPTIGTATGNDVATVTSGTSFGNSTLQTGNAINSPQVAVRDPSIKALGALLVDGGLGAPSARTKGFATNNGLIGFGNGWGVRFRINATAFDVATSQAGPMRIKVNGAWNTVYTPSPNFEFHYIKFTFPTKAVRDIEIYFQYGDTVTGFNVATGDTLITAPALSPLSAAIFGDSYVCAATYTVTTPRQSYAAKVSEAIGLPDLLLLGVGGQGAVATDPVGTKTFVDRVSASDLTQRSNLDLLLFNGSINDYTQTAATLYTNWRTILQAAKSQQPNAFIWGFEGLQVGTFVPDTSHLNAVANAFADENDGRVGFWNGFGSLSSFTSGDGTHPDEAGATTLAGITTPQLVSYLTSKS